MYLFVTVKYIQSHYFFSVSNKTYYHGCQIPVQLLFPALTPDGCVKHAIKKVAACF